MRSRKHGSTLLWATAGVLAVTMLGATGCVGDDPSGPSPVSIENTDFAPQLNIDLDAMTRTDEGLYYRDLVVGSGAEVEPGDSIAVHYTAWLADGTQIETSTGGSPVSVRVGVGNLIAGWEVGVPGIREGGKRKLIIPYQLAYGSYSVGIVPAYANLVFDVEVVSIHGQADVVME